MKNLWKKAAYIIPLAILCYILYANYLPFGYDETFVIKTGLPGDRDGQFSLYESQGLSPRKVGADGSTYRDLLGFVYTKFKPRAILRDATATVSVKDEGIFVISPTLDVDPTALPWDYQWAIASSTDQCTYFDGSSTKFTIPSEDTKLDGGPFTVYAEWTPTDGEHASQLIVGHYHWELIQNKDDVHFYISTREGEEGVRSIKYAIDDSKFFNKSHTALAIYSPATLELPNGYIDLYVDDLFAGRTYFANETVQKEGLAERDITLGKSGHSDASFFSGCIADVRIMKNSYNTTRKEATFKVDRDTDEFAIPLVNNGVSSSTLTNVTLHVVQE